MLRYFPGSEPEGTPQHAQDAPEPEPTAVSTHPAGAGRSAQQRAEDDDEPIAWAVPVIGQGGDDPPASARAVPEKAHTVSLSTISTRDTSEEELRRKLLAREFAPDDVEAEVARLRSVGLLDDRALAERLVDRLRERKGLGDQAIRPALRARFIGVDIIDAVLAGEHDEVADQNRVLELARDRARRLGALDPAVAERRLLAYLARKGHGGADARRAVQAALRERG